MSKRDYKKEYANESKARKKKRVNRNLARRIMKRKGLVKKGDKKAVIKEVGFALQKRAKQILGKSVTNTTDDPVTQQEQENIARAMAAYAYIVKQESPDSAIDWYTKSIQDAIDAVATIYPEIKTDRNHRAAYSMAVSITSQGVNVERNANIGLAIYEHWRQGVGVFCPTQF